MLKSGKTTADAADTVAPDIFNTLMFQWSRDLCLIEASHTLYLQTKPLYFIGSFQYNMKMFWKISAIFSL